MSIRPYWTLSLFQSGLIFANVTGRSTGKFLSEALILGSTNPQYDKRLFIDLPVQYMKITSSEHGENMLCAKIVLNVKTKTKNLSSYCGLVDARISASDKDLPVKTFPF